MNFLQDILSELKQEGAVTRRHLEKVDFQKAEFQPHEKSEKLGRLAIHVAEIIAWWKNVLAQLGVYLRMLDIPIPAVYGPSADDENITLIEKFN